MTNSFSSMFVFFRVLNSLLILLIFLYIYKKYVKKFLKNSEHVANDNKQKQEDRIILLRAEHLESEQELKKQAAEIYQFNSNMQLWQKKIDANHKIKKQLQLDLFLKIKEQALRKTKNQALRQNLFELAHDLINDQNFKNKINDLFEDKKIQEKYLNKSLELINEHQ